MKFNHMVKHDGKFYSAGTEVPISLTLNGSQVGTVDAEAAEELGTQAGEVLKDVEIAGADDDGKKSPGRKVIEK